MQRKDITAQAFGYLTVLTQEGKDSQGMLLWKCLCHCGTTVITRGTSLRAGVTTSCGCVGKSNLLLPKKHGMATTPTYLSYRSMLTRCLNPKHKNYLRYGGIGITVCQAWLDSFETFYADMGVRPKGMTLDRKDGTKGYYKDNCRWATKLEQVCNMKNNRTLEYEGAIKPLPYWANYFGVSSDWLRNNTIQGNNSLSDLIASGKLNNI